MMGVGAHSSRGRRPQRKGPSPARERVELVSFAETKTTSLGRKCLGGGFEECASVPFVESLSFVGFLR